MPETGKELIGYETPGQLVERKPQDVIQQMTEWANALMDVVEKKNLYVLIGQKKHIQVEGWQTIGHFDGRALPIPEYVKAIEDNGQKIGYEAKVNIVRRGEVISAAISFCGLDESVCKGKQGSEKLNACMSMAQTRAASKAYRLAYSMVAVLAGYEATPAEEMIGQKEEEREEKRQEASMGLCPIHHKPFRVGKSGGYCSTKMPDGTWCKEKPKAVGNITPARRQDLASGILEGEVVGEVAKQDKPVDNPSTLRPGSWGDVAALGAKYGKDREATANTLGFKTWGALTASHQPIAELLAQLEALLGE